MFALQPHCANIEILDLDSYDFRSKSMTYQSLTSSGHWIMNIRSWMRGFVALNSWRLTIFSHLWFPSGTLERGRRKNHRSRSRFATKALESESEFLKGNIEYSCSIFQSNTTVVSHRRCETYHDIVEDMTSSYLIPSMDPKKIPSIDTNGSSTRGRAFYWTDLVFPYCLNQSTLGGPNPGIE